MRGTTVRAPSGAALLLLVLAASGEARAEVGPEAELRMPHVVAGEIDRRLHVSVDAAATYGIASQSALGLLVRGSGSLPVWSTGFATGTLDFGLQLSYLNEPVALAPWIDPNEVSGAGHLVSLVATLGHTIFMGRGRRSSLGLLVFGGWSHKAATYALDWEREGISGSGSFHHDDPVVGAELRYGYRFSRHVGATLYAGAPLPTQSAYVIGMLYVGVGLTLYVL